MLDDSTRRGLAFNERSPKRGCRRSPASRLSYMHYYRTILRADYRPSLDFYEKLFVLAQSVEGFPDWGTDRLSVTLRDTTNRCSVHLGHDVFWYSQDLKGQPEKDDKRIRQLLLNVAPQLKKDTYTRVGFRRIYLHDVQMSFNQLVSHLSRKFLVQAKEITEGIFPRPTDLAYVFHFDEGAANIRLQLGPVKRSELGLHLVPDLASNFGPNEQNLGPEELYKETVEPSLFVDIDFAQKDMEAGTLVEFYESALALHGKLGHNITTYLFGIGE